MNMLYSIHEELIEGEYKNTEVIPLIGSGISKKNGENNFNL